MNYSVKILIQNYLKHRYSFVLVSISLLIASLICLISLFYAGREFSFDRFHANYEDIHRVEIHMTLADGSEINSTRTCGLLAPTLLTDMPEVKEYCRVHKARNGDLVQFENIRYHETNIGWVDSTFFQLFNFQLIQGDAALNGPHEAVISKSMAQKIFRKENPVGKTLSIEKLDYLITGVFDDMPKNTHFKFNILCSYSTFTKYWIGWAQGWNSREFQTYVKLAPNANLTNLQKNLPAFTQKYKGRIAARENYKLHYKLKSLKDIHLHSNLRFELSQNGDYNKVRILMLLSLISLVLAWANFGNLLSAITHEKSKAVGIQKLFGISFSNIFISRFLVSFIFSVSIFLLSIIIFLITKPIINNYLTVDYHFISYFAFEGVLVLLALLIVFPLLATINSILKAHSFTAQKVIAEKDKTYKAAVSSIKVFITLQYVISLAVLIFMFCIQKQFHYINTKYLGYDIDNLLVINGPKLTPNKVYPSKLEAFKMELLKYDQIKGITASSGIPGKEILFYTSTKRLDKENAELIPIPNLAIDHDFFKTYNISLKEGRDFSGKGETDNENIILNKKGISQYFPEDYNNALGNRLKDGNRQKIIKGITDDFHFYSLKKGYTPILFYHSSYAKFYITINLQAEDKGSTVSLIKQAWDKIFPTEAFDYMYLRDFYNKQYSADNQLRTLLAIITLFIVIISSISTINMSNTLYNNMKRSVCIKKIFGASYFDISVVFLKMILTLCGIASVFGVAIGYLISHKWLNTFAYKIDISLGLIVVPIAILFLIVILSILSNLIRTAFLNPVNILKE